MPREIKLRNSDHENRIDEYIKSVLERNILSSFFTSIETDILSEIQEHGTYNQQIDLTKLKLLGLTALQEMFKTRVALSGAMDRRHERLLNGHIAQGEELHNLEQQLNSFTRIKAFEFLESFAPVLGIDYFFTQKDRQYLIDPNQETPRAEFLRYFANYVSDIYSQCIGNKFYTQNIAEGYSAASSVATKQELGNVNKDEFEERMRITAYHFIEEQIKILKGEQVVRNSWQSEMLESKRFHQQQDQDEAQPINWQGLIGNPQDRAQSFCDRVRQFFGCERGAGRAHGD